MGLPYSGIEEILVPEKVLSRFIRDQEQILADEQGKPLLSDLTPHLEYYYFPVPTAPISWQRGQSLASFAGRIEGCNEICLLKILAQ